VADASRGRSVVSPLTLVAPRRRPAGAAWPMLSRAMLHALAVVAGNGAPPRDGTKAAIRDYRLARRLLTAEREFETEYVMTHLQETIRRLGLGLGRFVRPVADDAGGRKQGE